MSGILQKIRRNEKNAKKLKIKFFFKKVRQEMF